MRNGTRHLVAGIALALAVGSPAMALPQASLATAEREPYVGENLPGDGYVAEVATEALRRGGFEAKISFFPFARAMSFAENGTQDGIMPVHDDDSLKARFVLSDPFPGDSIGLLKLKSLPARFVVDPQKDLGRALKGLGAYRFGAVRGTTVAREFDDADYLRKELLTENGQLLKMLALKRIDLAIMDKYTAADLMVKKEPQLIGQLEFMEPPLAERPFRIAFSRLAPNHQAKVQAFNEGLRTMVKDGTLQRIIDKHGMFDRPPGLPGKTTLVIATVDNGDMVVMQRLSDSYVRQHPEVRLVWRVLDENTLRTRMMSDLAISDGRYDVMTIGSYEAPIWAKNGWLAPLRNLPSAYDLADVLQPIKATISYGKDLYALPFYGESSMTYYRKDLFAKAGLTMPENPTYQDILRFAAVLHKPSAKVYGIGLRGLPGWGENMAFLSTLVNTFGGQWFDGTWNPTINTAEWKAAISFYTDILRKYGPPNPTSLGFNGNLKLFLDGECAMWIDATVAAGALFNPRLSKVADKVGIANAPFAATPKGSRWLWTWALAVPSSSRQQKAAQDFITWATSKEYIALVANSQGWVAAPPGTRKSTYANPEYIAAAPFAKFVLAAMESANPNDQTLRQVPYSGIQYVGIPEFPAIATQVGQLMAKAVTGEVTIEAALASAQALAVNQMRASGYIK